MEGVSNGSFSIARFSKMNSIAAVLGRIKGEWQKQFSDELILGLSREVQLHLL